MRYLVLILAIVAVALVGVVWGSAAYMDAQAQWALAEAARLQAEASLVTAETLRAVMHQQYLFNLLQLGISAVLVYGFASQRVVYVPRGKGE